MKIDIDTKQRLHSAINFTLEFYKIVMGTFLIAFVPQKCDDHVCSITENIYNTDDILHLCANIYNAITFIVVLHFYRIELMRENWSITHLDIDSSKPNTNLDLEIEFYPDIKEKMYKLNKTYLLHTTRATVFLIINFILSSISIGFNHVGMNTITTIVSFLLLVTSKIINSRNIAKLSKQEEHVFSAYMKKAVVFNTIDEDFKKNQEIENKEDIENTILVEEINDDTKI